MLHCQLRFAYSGAEVKPLKLTPEQLQLALKLEGIFMPQAREQREEAGKRQAKPGQQAAVGEYLRFAHYTSARGGPTNYQDQACLAAQCHLHV